MTVKNKTNQNLLRTVAMILLAIGAIGALFFMFKAGSNQKSIILTGVFTVWVLSPFVGLFIANHVTSIWTVITRQLLYWLMTGLTIVSLIAYSGLETLPNEKSAFIYLAFPFVSWFVILPIFLIARKLSHKKTTLSKI
jgi:hypothetical protein